MKKHIIVAGVPRAGKTTLSRRLSKEHGYQHISMDSIIAGFENCFPELGINTYADMSSEDILFNISGKIAPFISAMIGGGEYEDEGDSMVIDIYQLLPDDYVRYIDPAKCAIVYLLTADVTPQERYEIQKKYDTPKDYTYHLPDAEIREGCEYLVAQSRLMREQCLRHGLAHYETSKDRERVIDALVAALKRE